MTAAEYEARIRTLERENLALVVECAELRRLVRALEERQTTTSAAGKGGEACSTSTPGP